MGFLGGRKTTSPTEEHSWLLVLSHNCIKDNAVDQKALGGNPNRH